MRLIDEKELKEWVENWFEVNRYYHPYSKSNNIPITELYDILEHMPTIDADTRRHGKLLRTEAYPHRLYCSECFKTLIPNEEICFEKNEFPKYCMWCGAKMDEEEAK